MNCIKKTMVCTTAAVAVTVASAAPVVSNVSMTQASGGRLVSITYSLSEEAVVTLDVLTNATPNAATGWASIGGEAICNAQGAVWRKVTSADADGEGKYMISWRPDLSWADEQGKGFKVADGCAKAVVTAWSLNNTPNYMVVDISSAAQPNTQRYYPAADFVPGGVTNNSIYKMSTLLMRKIMARDVEWTMGSVSTEIGRTPANEATHQVALTNNYYIGVFPITQSQWTEVATNSSVTSISMGQMRPMDSVSYNEIRLKANSNAEATSSEIANYSWPKAPCPSSYLGLLRLKTGLDFDLPSDAEWEFAARAGHGSGYWGDGSEIVSNSTDENLSKHGRYANNGGSSGRTTIVGAYLPNSWGLYDMSGNLCEWCLDWFEANVATTKDGAGELYRGRVNINPADPSKTLSGGNGGNRVKRGGSWYHAASVCRPAARDGGAGTRRGSDGGFRVVCTAGLE